MFTAVHVNIHMRGFTYATAALSITLFCYSTRAASPDMEEAQRHGGMKKSEYPANPSEKYHTSINHTPVALAFCSAVSLFCT